MKDEMIGNVKLNYACYAGEDLYTDGAVEDEILEIVKKYPRSEYNRVIAERKSWPVLYHLSHIRGNILRQIPMTGYEHVLEVGAGCGAITTLAPKYICVKNCELLQYPKYIGSTMSDLSSSFNFKDFIFDFTFVIKLLCVNMTLLGLLVVPDVCNIIAVSCTLTPLSILSDNNLDFPSN